MISIDVIYYYVIWTDKGVCYLKRTLIGKRGNIQVKVLQCCICELLHSVNSVPILYRTGNMQSAILLSFVTTSSLPPCGLQSNHPLMPCYISPYVVYIVYDDQYIRMDVKCQNLHVTTFQYIIMHVTSMHLHATTRLSLYQSYHH